MIPNDDAHYMRMALKEAAQAEKEGEVPIGAVMVCQGQVIARTHNQTETLNDPTAHAEIVAVTSATNTLGSKYLANCTLYVTLEPCVMCAGALGWAQVGRVVFGADDEKRGYSRFAPQAFHPKTEITKGILSDECAKLLTDFFRRKR